MSKSSEIFLWNEICEGQNDFVGKATRECGDIGEYPA